VGGGGGGEGGSLIRKDMETRSKHHVFSLGGNLKKNIYTDQSGILHQITLHVGIHNRLFKEKELF